MTQPMFHGIQTRHIIETMSVFQQDGKHVKKRTKSNEEFNSSSSGDHLNAHDP